MRFPSKAATFMRELQRHQDRDWFKDNKHRYEDAKAEVEAFAKTVHDALAEHDELEPPKRSPITRIYRDTRFSKDKTPYKRFWGGGPDRLGKDRRGGYYWHVEPGGIKTWEDVVGGEAFVGGGFWAPERDDLRRIREELAADHVAFREMLAAEPVAERFPGGLHAGEMLKTAPRDYPKDHPAIDLLRHKNYVLLRHFDRRQVASADFSDEVVRTFVAMRPFLDYMTDALTTDANGQPLG